MKISAQKIFTLGAPNKTSLDMYNRIFNTPLRKILTKASSILLKNNFFRYLVNLFAHFSCSLTLPVPCISESCIEGLKGLHKTFWSTTKKCKNKNLSYFFLLVWSWDAIGRRLFQSQRNSSPEFSNLSNFPFPDSDK